MNSETEETLPVFFHGRPDVILEGILAAMLKGDGTFKQNYSKFLDRLQYDICTSNILLLYIYIHLWIILLHLHIRDTPLLIVMIYLFVKLIYIA